MKMMKNKWFALASVVTAIAATSVQAITYPTLTISDGVNPAVVVEDSGPGDLAPVVGAVTYSGAIGNWIVVASTGISSPPLPNPPHLDLNFSATSVAPGTLTITLSAIGFNYLGILNDLFGGTSGGSVTDQIVVNGEVVVTRQGPFAVGAFSADTLSSIVNLGPQDVLSLVVTVTHGEGVHVSSGDKEVTRVPDGGTTVTLLGAALSGLAWVNARRKK